MMRGIESDSRKVKPGFTFVAIRGLTFDGHDFIREAIERGATAVVGERKRPSWLDAKIKYTKVDDSRKALGELAADFYDNPSHKLITIGVTGTKGKTTTSHLVYHILKNLGKRVGLISSISVPGLHVTTPDVITLHKMLYEMVKGGCQYAVIEVSSHGIEQKRIAAVTFNVGVLTNIAPEHLDYHKSFSNYKRVKMSFLDSAKVKIISPKSTKLTLLPGKFNNLNIESALRTVEALGFDRKKAMTTLHSFKLPEGRLERVKNNLGIGVYVDFAHTPDSLKAALTYLKGITKGKLIAVIGSAGERDRKKRFVMGKISTQIADLSVFTAEDPRSEDVFKILGAMEKYAQKGKFIVIPERGEAIVHALMKAKRGDTVAVLGKGHEKSMAYGRYEHPWDDKKAIVSFLKGESDAAAVVLAAGRGARMKSARPKVVHTICNRPMIAYTLENLRRAGLREIVVVVSFGKDLVLREIAGAIEAAVQKKPKGGTADAVRAGLNKISPQIKTVLVANGDDSAFYNPQTIRAVIKFHQKSGSVLTFVSLRKSNPYGLGRVVRSAKGSVLSIVEERNATQTQKKIKEVNIGLYVFNRKWLDRNISQVKISPQGEYYLVDLVKMAIDQGKKVNIYKLADAMQWQGINTPEQLAEAEGKMEQKLKL